MYCPHLFCFVWSLLTSYFFSPFQACGDPKAKPSYLVDKNLESAVKFIVRKFPAVETRNNNVSTPACTSALRLCDTESQRMKERPVTGVIVLISAPTCAALTKTPRVAKRETDHRKPKSAAVTCPVEFPSEKANVALVIEKSGLFYLTYKQMTCVKFNFKSL